MTMCHLCHVTCDKGAGIVTHDTMTHPPVLLSQPDPPADIGQVGSIRKLFRIITFNFYSLVGMEIERHSKFQLN